jgi:hypothetical protein
VNIPLDIKKLVAEKRRATAKWQRSHAPADKTAFNRLSNILKTKLKAIRANYFETYVSTLSRHDASFWKPIKPSRKPIQASPPLRIESPSHERWAASDKDKAAVFATHLADVFRPHEPDEEILEYLASPVLSTAPVKLVTPKEIKEETGCLH